MIVSKCFYDIITIMKITISLFLLSLVLITSLVNAQGVNTEQQHAHSINQTMDLSMNGNMDCCFDEGAHINCGSVAVIDIPVIFSQEIAKNFVLLIPAFDASYASFVFKIPTPPPTT